VTVQLNGSGSSDADGDLSRTGVFCSRPPESAASLANPTTVTQHSPLTKRETTSFKLIVNDGKVDSALDTVIISTQNSARWPMQGDQTALVTQTVTLDGSRSSDVDGDPLTFKWALITKPADSKAVLSDLNAVNPPCCGHPGTYVAQLIVNDGKVDSEPDTVTSTQPILLLLLGEPDQTAFVTQTVTVDGSQSSDVDGDSMTFSWSFVSQPPGSAATLSDLSASKPTFVVDKPATMSFSSLSMTDLKPAHLIR